MSVVTDDVSKVNAGPMGQEALDASHVTRALTLAVRGDEIFVDIDPNYEEEALGLLLSAAVLYAKVNQKEGELREDIAQIYPKLRGGENQALPLSPVAPLVDKFPEGSKPRFEF